MLPNSSLMTGFFYRRDITSASQITGPLAEEFFKMAPFKRGQFSKTLKHFRGEQKSYRDLIALLGLSVGLPTIKSWVRGEAYPNSESRFRITQGLFQALQTQEQERSLRLMEARERVQEIRTKRTDKPAPEEPMSRPFRQDKLPALAQWVDTLEADSLEFLGGVEEDPLDQITIAIGMTEVVLEGPSWALGRIKVRVGPKS